MKNPRPASAAQLAQWLRAELAQILDRPTDEIDMTRTFAQLGVDSAMAVHLVLALEDKLQVELDPDRVANLRTIDALVAYALSLVPGTPSRS